jgi:predicted nuclease of restriction endonuclease-like RecB superfamily
MRTVSYSLDEETERGISSIAQQLKMSKSDVVRAMYARIRLEKTFEQMQTQAEPLLKKLGLDSEDDIATFSKRSS